MKWIYLFGYLAMPVVAVVHLWLGHKSWEPAVTFVLAGLSIVPLARLMGQATECLAAKTGPTFGGLINATFGNAAELIIGIVALCRGLNEVAMASLAGSIMGNLLLVAGAAMLAGGWRRERQSYSRASAEANAGLLVVAVTGMLLPAMFHFSFAGRDPLLARHEHGISIGTSVVLMLVYGLGLLFTLRTHGHIFSPRPARTNEDPAGLSGVSGNWSTRKSLLALLVASAAVALFSEWLVGSVELAAESLHLNYVFVGVILVAIIGNAAEHSTAIVLARRNDMDTAMTIVFQSSLQIALFVTPVLILLSAVLVAAGVPGARPLNLVFSPLEVVGVFVSVGIVVTLSRNGESNWFEGVLLLAVYAILAITFFYVPPGASSGYDVGKPGGATRILHWAIRRAGSRLFSKEIHMSLRENELARRNPTGVELRPGPLRVKWEFLDLETADKHELRCTFTGSLRAVAENASDVEMLEEVLLDGRDSVSADDVARHFYAALHGAANRVSQQHTAKEWLESEQPRQSFIEALKKEAKRIAFACGLEEMPPFEVNFQSATFERQRQRSMQQALMEKEAAGQVEHFQRSAELLKQFQVLRGSAPELSAGRVLQQINPGDQGSLMQALLMAGARQQASATIWAVAGPSLVKIEANIPLESKSPPKPQVFSLPPTLGPLRSVQTEEVDGRRVLLIGAQQGFLLVHEDDLSSVESYRDAALSSQLGFNRVIYWPQRKQFCATHSEGGIVCWNVDSPGAPTKAVRAAVLGVAPAAAPDLSALSHSNVSIASGAGSMGPRNLRRIDADTLVFSAGGRVILWDGGFAKTVAEASPAEIVMILLNEQSIFAVHEDGTLCEINYKTRKVVSAERRFGKVRTAATLPWLGAARMLVATDDGPVQCVGFDDPLITQYSSAYRGLRVLAGSAGMVAAVSPDRQRLILWNSWEGRQPTNELFVSAVTRHRLADIAFA